MGFHFEGLGVATPPYEIRQDDAATWAHATSASAVTDTKVISQLYRRSGVKTRRSVVLESSTNGAPARQSFFSPPTSDRQRGPTTAERMRAYDSHAAELATTAARRALADAHMNARDITHLITVSCTGFQAPGVDLSLCEQLDLSDGVARTHIGFMGCHAALNALRVADAFARADSTSRILVCAVELCSLHFQYSGRNDQIVSNSLFADGAAAVAGRGGRNDESWATIEASGSARLRATSDMMSWRIGDNGFEMTLSARVPAVIKRELRPWITAWLAECGLDIAEIDHWAIHPGGPRILDACGESLGLVASDLEPSRSVLARYGNMSSPTALFVLQQILQTTTAGRCVMLAFGPGLAIEATLIGLSPAGHTDQGRSWTR
jgi:predicted naringenin-chalcone synthase